MARRARAQKVLNLKDNLIDKALGAHAGSTEPDNADRPLLECATQEELAHARIVQKGLRGIVQARLP